MTPVAVREKREKLTPPSVMFVPKGEGCPAVAIAFMVIRKNRAGAVILASRGPVSHPDFVQLPWAA